jgi:hypothetical protein
MDRGADQNPTRGEQGQRGGERTGEPPVDGTRQDQRRANRTDGQYQKVAEQPRG